MDTRPLHPPPYIMPGVCKIALHWRLFQFTIFFLLEGSSQIKNVTEFLNYLLCHNQTFIFVHMTNYIYVCSNQIKDSFTLFRSEIPWKRFIRTTTCFLPQSMAPLLCNFQKTWLTFMWISINPINFPIVNRSGCTELDMTWIESIPMGNFKIIPSTILANIHGL